ncbi:MAG: GAF domain-containing protein [Prochloraceae cyanobacterium]
MAEIKIQVRKNGRIELDQEKIHVSGLIQPHGVVIVLKEPELEILQISDNAGYFFATSAEDLLGQKLENLFDSFQIERIEPALRSENLDFINPSKLWARTVGDEYAVFDGIFHRNSEGFLILELEPATSEENIPFLSFYHLAKISINQLQETASHQDFCQIIVREVRKITGFDRVMLYKFDEDNHGVVIAEEKASDMEAYLGLHYPASDIPKPARKLFASNYIRIIPDARAMPAELIPAENPITNSRLDLTNSTLRSASGCHLEYLQNMEVGASLTISLLKDGQLWGLIACHHRSPKYVSYELRKACELLGKVIFSEISSREETEDYDYKMKLTYIGSKLIDILI